MASKPLDLNDVFTFGQQQHPGLITRLTVVFLSTTAFICLVGHDVPTQGLAVGCQAQLAVVAAAAGHGVLKIDFQGPAHRLFESFSARVFLHGPLRRHHVVGFGFIDNEWSKCRQAFFSAIGF